MPAHKVIVVFLGAWLAAALSSGQAHADTPGSVAVLSVNVKGGAAAQIRSQVQDSVARNLQAAGLQVVSQDELAAALRKQRRLARCTRGRCLAQVASAVGVDRLLRIAVEASGATYSFEIEVIDASGSVIAQVQDACPVCTVAEASDQVGEAVAEALTDRAAPPGQDEITVEIVTSPEGARLRVNGQDMGVAPFRGPLPAGSHTVSASLDGHHDAELNIELAQSDEPLQRFELGLVARRDDGGTEIEGRPFRTLKWAGAGATVATVGTGLLWVILHDRGTCSGNVTCEELYDTGAQGIATLAVGAVMGAATTWMFLRDRDDARRQLSVTAAPTAGGAMASVRLSF